MSIITRQKQVLLFPLFLLFYQFVAYLSNDMYLPSLPTICAEFDVSPHIVKKTMTFWFIGSGAFQLIFGILSEKIGRRPVLLFGNFVFVISCILCVCSYNIDMMIFARSLQGMGVSCIFVAGYATIHELYDRKRAIQTFAIMGSIAVIAPAIGPSLGVLVLSYSSWRTIFLILAVLGGITFFFLTIFMPESLKESDDSSLRKLFTEYFLIIKNPNFMRFTLSFCFLLSISFLWILESPFIIIKSFGKSELFYALLQIPIFTGSIIGAQITRYRITRCDVNTIIRQGLNFIIIPSIIFCILSLLSFHSDFYTIVQIISITLLMSLITCCNSTMISPLNRLAIESSDAKTANKTALLSTFVSISAAFFTYFISFLKYSGFLGVSFASLCLICIVRSMCSKII